jgi:hypothetical protein
LSEQAFGEVSNVGSKGDLSADQLVSVVSSIEESVDRSSLQENPASTGATAPNL